MILLEEKPTFPDRLGPHCQKKEENHNCVRPEFHTGICYCVVFDDSGIVSWYAMENAR